MTEINLKEYIESLDALLAEDSSADEVIHHCRHILQYHPKNVAAYRLLGRALHADGQIAEAGEMYRRVLSVFPLDFVANAGLGEVYAKTGKPDLAIWHTERAFDQKPANAQIIERLRDYYREFRGTEVGRIPLTAGAVAQQHLRNGNYEAAAEAVLQALSRSRTRVDLLILLSQALWLDGKRVDAAEVAVEVLKTLPYSLQANRILTLLWLQERRPSDAQRYLNRIEDIDPYLARELATGQPAPDDAVVLEELDYDRIAQQRMASASPDWLDTFDTTADGSADVGVATDDEIPDLDFDDMDLDEAADDTSPEWLDEVDHMVEKGAEKTVAASLEDIMQTTDTDLSVDDLFDVDDVDADSEDWLEDAAEQGTPSSEEKTGLTGLLESLDSDSSDDDDFLDDLDVDDFAADEDWLAEADASAAPDTSSKSTGLTGLLSSLDDDDEDEDDFLEDIDDIDVDEFLSQTDAVSDEDLDFAEVAEDEFETGADSMAWLQQDDDEAPAPDAIPATRGLDMPSSDYADPMAWMKSSGVEYDDTGGLADVPYSDDDEVSVKSADVDPMAWARSAGVEVESDDSGINLFDDDDFDVEEESAGDDPMAWMKSTGVEFVEDDEPAAPAPARETPLPQADDSLDWLQDDAALDEMLSLEQLSGDDESPDWGSAAAEVQEEDWQPPQTDDIDMEQAEAEMGSMEWLDEDAGEFDGQEFEEADEETAFDFEESADEDTPDWLDEEEADEAFVAESAVEAPDDDTGDLFSAINAGADDEDEFDEAFEIKATADAGGLFDEIDDETEGWLQDAEDEELFEAEAAVDNLLEEVDAETDDWLEEAEAEDEADAESSVGEAVGAEGGLFDDMDDEYDESEDWMEEDTGQSQAIRDEDLEAEEGDWLDEDAPADEEFVAEDDFSPVATDAYALGTAAASELYDSEIDDNLSDEEWLDDATDTWEQPAITDEDLMEADAAYDEAESDEAEWFDNQQQFEAAETTTSTSESQVISDLFGEDDNVVEYGTSEASTVQDGVEWFGDEDEPWLEEEGGEYVAEQDSEVIAGMFDGDSVTQMDAPVMEDSGWVAEGDEAAWLDEDDDTEDPSWMDRDTAFEASAESVEADDDVFDPSAPALATDEVEAFMSAGSDRAPNMGDTGELFADYVEMAADDEEENTPSWMTQDMMREATEAALQDDDVTAVQTEGDSMSDWLDSDDSFDWASEGDEADELPIASAGDTGGLFSMDEDEEEAVLDWMSDEDELIGDALPASGDTGELPAIDDGAAFNWQDDLEADELEEESPGWLMGDMEEAEEEEALTSARTTNWLTDTGEIQIDDEDDIAAPSWLSDVGGYDADALEAADDEPDWLTEEEAADEMTFGKAASMAAMDETADEEVPGWLAEMELDDDEEADAAPMPDWLNETGAEQDDELAFEEDAPDWLSDAAPAMAVETEDEDGFDWVDEVEDDEEAQPVVAATSDESDYDWDDELAEAEEDLEIDAPDWLAGAAPMMEAASADEDGFDWVDEVEEEAESSGEGLDWDAEDDEDEAVAAVAGVPDWLSDAAPALEMEGDDDFDLEDDFEDEEEAEVVGEGFDWDGDDEEEAVAAESGVPDWLSDSAPIVAEEAGADDDFDLEDDYEDEEEAEVVGEGFDWDGDDEDEAVAAESGVPDWLSDAAPIVAEEVGADDDFDLEDDYEDEEAAEGVGEGFDWDAEIGEEADDVEEEAVAADVPDWLNAIGDDVEQDEPEPAAPVMSSTANQDVPDWLLDEGLDFGDEADEAPAASIESVEYVEYEDEDVLDDEEIAPAAAGNAPDWLNAMVPGLDLDYEAEEDAPVEQSYLTDDGGHRRVPNAAGEFAWLLDIVDEETSGMTPIRSRRRFVFSQDPLWLRAPTAPPPNLPDGGEAVAQAVSADWLNDFDDDFDDDFGDDDGLDLDDYDDDDMNGFDSLDDFEAFDEFDPDFLDDDDDF